MPKKNDDLPFQAIDPDPKTKEKNRKFTLVCGLPSSGKTHSLLEILHHTSADFFACKPFDKALQLKNAQEKKCDAELFQAAKKENLHINLFSPYIAYFDAPFEYALGLEGLKVNWKTVESYQKIWEKSYQKVWIESLGSVFEPLDFQVNFLEWSLQLATSALFVLDPDPKNFQHNLSEILHLQKKFSPFAVLINNRKNISDARWLEYCWLKLEQDLNLKVLGLQAYQPKKESQPQRGKKEKEKQAEENFSNFWVEEAIRLFSP